MSKGLQMHLGVHNKFLVQRIRNGCVDKEAHAYNVVTNAFNYCLSGDTWHSNPFYVLGIGTGEGEPSVNDSHLFNRLIDATTTTVSTHAEYPTSTLVLKATFPASEQYVGTLTEVGLSGFSTTMSKFDYITHAMLQDSEGQRITIEKTSIDIIVVTATVYITFEHNLDYIVPASQNGIIKALFNKSTSNGMAGMIGDASLVSEVATTQFATLGTWYGYPNVVSRFGGLLGSNDLPNSANRVMKTSVKRIQTDAGNGLCARYIKCDLGYKRITAEDFPPYELQPMSVGTGDGVTTSFTCPIPVFIEGTEEVKVNGVVMSRGTDYTVDPSGNSCLNPSYSIHTDASIAWSGSNEYSSGPVAPIFLGAKASYNGGESGSVSPSCGWLKNDGHYMLFDVHEPRLCNTVVLTKLCTVRSNASMTCSIVFEYSNNKQDWTPLVTIPEDTYSGISSGGKDPIGGPVFTFEPVTAQYWRIRLICKKNNSYALGCTTAGCFFGYTGQGIVFTNPPVEGAEITVKATVDKPFKTDKYVLDWSGSFSY